MTVEEQVGIEWDLRWVEESLIDPNPWQPRTTRNPKSIERLAASIDQDTLLQEPGGRAHGLRVQLAWGQGRVKAIRLLIRDARWSGTRIPVKVGDLTDEQMARFALAENTEREDLSDELRAYRKALIDLDAAIRGEDGVQQEPRVSARREGAVSEKVILRPEVKWFAEQMELKLRTNDWKGGWDGEDELWLWSRMMEEAAELHSAAFMPGERTLSRIAGEAADVANFAMMLADRFRE